MSVTWFVNALKDVQTNTESPKYNTLQPKSNITRGKRCSQFRRFMGLSSQMSQQSQESQQLTKTKVSSSNIFFQNERIQVYFINLYTFINSI